jgi:hypothetical protein
MDSTEQTIKEKAQRPPTAPARRLFVLSKSLYATLYTIAALTYGIAACEILRRGKTFLPELIWAFCLTGLVGLVCRHLSTKTRPAVASCLHAVASQAAALCFIHGGLLSLTTGLLDDKSDSLPLLGFAFAATTVAWSYQTLKLLLMLRVKPTSGPEAKTNAATYGTPYVAPLSALVEELAEGEVAFVSPTAIFVTGGGTYMVDGATPASNLLDSEYTLELTRFEHGFTVMSLPRETSEAVRIVLGHEMPEISYVVRNQEER